MSLGEYLKETRGELKHVSWPTREQIISYTIVVIIISIVTSIYLGVFDFGFSIIFNRFFK
jgi:preprotein translocase subunit SecE